MTGWKFGLLSDLGRNANKEISLDLLQIITMESIITEWMYSSHKMFSDGWIANEVGAMKALIQQRKGPPVSVEQARKQVQLLKEKSQSTVKKGHDRMQS